MNEKLIEKRGERSQTTVANAVGISVPYYNMIERGKRVPPYRIMKKIADYYNVKPDYFFYKKF